MTSDHTPDEAEELLGSRLDDAVPSHGYRSVPVAGIGASGTDRDAVLRLLGAMPKAPGMACVVLFHGAGFASDAPAWLAEVRSKTPMAVVSLERSTRIEPNTVYLVPPQRGARALDGSVLLTDGEAAHGWMVIDLFLRSLADTHGAHSAAVVLSGSTADGSIGLKRIKERGGLTVAQDPDEAEHEAMPRSAIGTGMVDWILPLEDIPARLLSYFKLEPELRLPPEDGPQLGEVVRPAGEDETALRDVLTLLRTRTGRDFAHYKRATILRRIGRRMQVNSVGNLQEYLNCLRTRPGEPAALLQDLLITVTNFFRDAGCFAALESHIPALFEGKGPNDAVRVWVTACATGEEAYSVAMLLNEHARTMEAPPQVQVFATDLDDEAIAAAREGIYPAAIEADVNEERLRRFFIKEHRGYRVRRELREMVLFAVHDVLKDSPFSRLDLVTCRNLLIYLGRDAQRRVFDIFHFALLPGGKLFLGSSEAVEDGSALFSVLDKKHRIYGQRSTPRVGLPVPTGPGTLAHAMELQQNLREGPVIAGAAFNAQPQRPIRGNDTGRVASWGELHLRLLEHLAPPSILVDAEYDIVHLSPTAGRFLRLGGGEPTRNLLRSVPPALRIELRAALYQAAQSHQTVQVPAVPLDLHGNAVPVSIQVTPANDIASDVFLVVLTEQAPNAGPPAPDSARPSPDPVAQHLDRELERLKAHLRDTVEQYEVSTEELMASNEELQAMNEELRSATEELETSREELQSINEELTTVNHELKSKVEELGHANSDMHNLMDATAIATVFLDRELRITRYTPSAVSLFNLIPTDVGRPLTDLTTQLQYPELGSDEQRVLERLVPVEREVGQTDGSWYLARLLPYRTIEDRIAGVVLSFINITERKQAEEVRLWLSAVVTSTADGIVSFSLDQTILSWNAGAERIFGYTAEDAIGQPLSILARQDAADWVVVPQRVENLETVRTRKDGSEVHVSITVSPIRDAGGKVMASTAIVRDITAARAAAEALRSSDEKLRQTVERTQGALRDQQLTAEDIRKRAERLLQQQELTPAQRELAEGIRRGAIPLQDAITRLLQGQD
ncbi:PAS domain S-box protein [Ramlibacter sp. G-1-2-2]|uniref:protein-glutamate O-methyltransferase n=1 Tax=Ramlibacter agri TaxID=2728837 RepID=A0A848H315_9BURK|nr:CheR family methyltransferase [Ramlibacter agri]NML45205.1 PAS domain S-box protein [Ramlibacter agri]